MARYRHGSQAFRLTLLTLGLVVPAVAFYPTMFQLAWQAKSQLVETRYAPQALDQRDTVQRAAQQQPGQIDQFPGLDRSRHPADGARRADDRSRVPGLADRRRCGLSGHVVGRGLRAGRRRWSAASRSTCRKTCRSAPPGESRSEETSCDWEIFEEVAPFFAEERRVLHAGRGSAPPARAGRSGSIVVHAMLDYENLPFISVAHPVRRAAATDRSARAARDAPGGTSSTPSTAGAARRSTRRATPPGRSTTRCSPASSSRATRSGPAAARARQPSTSTC